MGLFKKLLGIGIATKTYQNIYNKPIGEMLEINSGHTNYLYGNHPI